MTRSLVIGTAARAGLLALLTIPALAAAGDCADTAAGRADAALAEAIGQRREARAVYFAPDWGTRLALADAEDRDGLAAERERARVAIKEGRAAVREARRDRRDVGRQVARGAVTCDAGTVASGE